MKAKFYFGDWTASTKFFFYRELGRNRFALVTDIQYGGRMQFQEIQEGDSVEFPTMLLSDQDSREFIQSFLDEAWEHGFRPTKEKKSREAVESEIRRLENHLEDLRTLIFNYDITDKKPIEPQVILKVKE